MACVCACVCVWGGGGGGGVVVKGKVRVRGGGCTSSRVYAPGIYSHAMCELPQETHVFVVVFV